MKKKRIRGEQLIKIGRLVYSKLYNEWGLVENDKEITFQDKNGEYDCKQLLWRFYWIFNY